MTKKSRLPKKKTEVQLHTLEIRAMKVMKVLDRLFIGRSAPINTIDMETICLEVEKLLPSTHVEDFHGTRQDALATLNSLLLGTTPEYKTLMQYALTVAGWWPWLVRGIPYRAWSPADGPVGVAAVVTNMLYLPGKTSVKNYLASVLCLYGPTAGVSWNVGVKAGEAIHLLRIIGGIKYAPYRPEDLTGMHFTAVLNQAGVFTEHYVSSGQKSRNLKLTKGRQQPCMKKLFATPDGAVAKCHNCRFGQDVCPLARRMTTLTVEGMCSNGHLGILHANGLCHLCNLKETS